MNGYLPVGRFYRLYRIVARKNEKQRVTIINLTHWQTDHLLPRDSRRVI